MNKIVEKLTQKVVSKPTKYYIICSILTLFLIAGIMLSASLIYMVVIAITVLMIQIVIDLIQYYSK